MKEIIEQIARIDSVAYENEQKNKSILSGEKQRLENEIKKYRDKKLEAAAEEANTVRQQILGKAQTDYQMQSEKVKRVSTQIENNFLKVEKDVIREVFDKLFTV